MVNPQTIRRAVELIREAAAPRRIILFGSHARGEAGDDSDVDLLVVEPAQADALGEMVRLRRILSPLRMPVDLLVVTEEYYQYWCDTPGNLMFEVALEGQVLYEAA